MGVSACVYLYCGVCDAHGGHKETPSFMELELQMVVSHHVSAGK